MLTVPPSETQGQSRIKRYFLVVLKQSLQCSGDFPCTNCRSMLSKVLTRRSCAGFQWSECFDSDVTQLNVFQCRKSTLDHCLETQLTLADKSHSGTRIISTISLTTMSYRKPTPS